MRYTLNEPEATDKTEEDQTKLRKIRNRGRPNTNNVVVTRHLLPFTYRSASRPEDLIS